MRWRDEITHLITLMKDFLEEEAVPEPLFLSYTTLGKHIGGGRGFGDQGFDFELTDRESISFEVKLSEKFILAIF